VAKATIRDRAYEILASSSGPMNYRDIAERVRAAGYKSRRLATGSQDQLKRSVWVALTRDERVVNVGSGTFDLAKR
jgi:soluble P-type ATPase